MLRHVRVRQHKRHVLRQAVGIRGHRGWSTESNEHAQGCTAKALAAASPSLTPRSLFFLNPPQMWCTPYHCCCCIACWSDHSLTAARHSAAEQADHALRSVADAHFCFSFVVSWIKRWCHCDGTDELPKQLLLRQCTLTRHSSHLADERAQLPRPALLLLLVSH